MTLDGMRLMETIWGRRLLELVIPAKLAWQFIDQDDETSWTFDYEGITYLGCRLRTRRPIDADYVRLTFTFKESRRGTDPPIASDPQQ